MCVWGKTKEIKTGRSTQGDGGPTRNRGLETSPQILPILGDRVCKSVGPPPIDREAIVNTSRTPFPSLHCPPTQRDSE